MKELSIIYKPIDQIKPYENNPRNNAAAITAVAASIKEFGFRVPIIIDKDNVIVAGHSRYNAAISLQMTEVPCVVADDLTQEQVKALRLADNKVGSFSLWDFSALSQELDELGDYDMQQFGFQTFDFDDLERMLNAKQPEPKKITCPYCGTEFEV